MTLLGIMTKNQKAIQQAELGALLHDIDKVLPDFLEKPANHTCPENLHNGDMSHKTREKRLGSMGWSNNITIVFSGIQTTHIQYWTDETITYDRQGKVSSIRADFDRVQSQYSLDINGRCPMDENNFGTLRDIASFHHASIYFDRMPMLAFLVHAAFGGADGIDSELDKNAPDASKQDKTSKLFQIDSPFGAGHTCWRDVTAELKGIFAEINYDNPELPLIKSRLRPILSKVLGETKYPCNDVTLWAHSYSVASLFKATLAKILIEYNQGTFSPENRYLLPVRSPGANDNATDFTFLKVSIDRNYLLSRAQKTGDIIGIGTQIIDIQDAIQDYVENTLLIGNETYRDEEKQLFLIPKLDTWVRESKKVFDGLHERFEQEISKCIDDKLTALLVERNCHDFPFATEFAPCSDTEDGDSVAKRILTRSRKLFIAMPNWRQSPSALVSVDLGTHAAGRCEVCGIRKIGFQQYEKDDRVCADCFNRRHNKVQWQKRNSEPHITSELEEIVNPSEENKLVLVSAFFELDSLLNGEIFEQVRWPGKNDQPEITKNASPGRVYRAYETLRFFFEDFQRHEIPALIPGGKIFPVTLSPVRLEFVCAGKKADTIISRLVCLYEQQFGKFRSVLPLSVGCIFFNRLFPLYVALETGHRLRGHLKPRHVEDWEVMASQKEADVHGLRWRLTLKPPALAATAGDKVVYDEWRMPITRSDDKEDTLYPHLRLADGQFRHVKEIKAGDRVQVRHGRFDFILLDSTGRRFAVSNQGLRHHLGHKRGSYPVTAWDDFQRLWKLASKLNKNQLGIIESLLVDKMHSWRSDWWLPDNPVIRQFCESVVMAPNAFGRKKDTGEYRFLDQDSNQDDPPENCDRNMLIRAAANGMLLDVFDFYFHAQKKDLAINNAITA